MNLPYELIRNLLPVHHDHVCSKASETHVSEHLTSCEKCRKVLAEIEAELIVPENEMDAAKPSLSFLEKLKNRERKMVLKYSCTVLACGTAL